MIDSKCYLCPGTCVTHVLTLFTPYSPQIRVQLGENGIAARPNLRGEGEPLCFWLASLSGVSASGLAALAALTT